MRKMLEADGVGSKLARVRNAGSAKVATAKCTVLTKFTGEPRCFTAGTLVQTENGTKSIEEIQVGDIVLATDPITLQTSYQEVTLLHISETEELIHVTIEIESADGQESKEEVIDATPSHPFYVEGADFIRADSLKEGDELKSETGLKITVKKLEYEKLEEPVKVYNLTISDDHTYYVGSVGVLVHNDGACGVGSGNGSTKPYTNSRPSFRKGVVDEVWENAKGPDGLVRDPNTGDILNWNPGESRKGIWDMGHIPEAKYSEMHEAYMNGDLTKSEFVDWYNDPNNYRPELPSNNRSHKYE